MYLLLPLLVVCFALLIHAMPAERFPRQYTSSNLDYLKNTFLGIYWDDAAVSCSGDQFNILAEATRMLGPFSNINPFHWDDNPAFNRFFVSPRKAKYGSSWHDSSTNQDAYLSIKSNIVQVNKFPTTGKKDRWGRFTQGKSVTYTCKEEDQLVGKCAKTPGLGAYRMVPSAYHNAGWAIMFCPLFFAKPYLNALTSGLPQPLAKLGSLYTYEHLLAHELLHCDIIGTKEPVNDMNGTVPGISGEVAIYGASKCNNWAWKDQGNGPGPVNIMTALNADNYAWYLTNNWFNSAWNWNEIVGGSPFPVSGRSSIPAIKRNNSSDEPAPIDDLDPSQPPNETPDDTTDASSIPDSAFLEAPNCHNTTGQDLGDDAMVCEYVGENYGEYLLEQSENFNSSGGCDLSDQCHNADGNAIDPSCVCTCNGEDTPLTDGRCGGFQGALPNPPPGQGSGTGP